MLTKVPAGKLYRFDRESRAIAVRLAGRLGIDTNLNVNALPGSLSDVAGESDALLEAARCWDIAPERLILEVTEQEAVDDSSRFAEVIDEYRALGVGLAIDDFGAGYSGLNLLADFQPDVIKLDMKLVRGIQSHGPRQSIARALALVCGELGIEVVAEGIETVDEFRWLRDLGVELFQGYLFGRPAFEVLGSATIPEAGNAGLVPPAAALLA